MSPSPNELLGSQPERAHHTTSPSVSHWQSATSADLQLPPRKKICCEKENIDEAIESKKVDEFAVYIVNTLILKIFRGEKLIAQG